VDDRGSSLIFPYPQSITNIFKRPGGSDVSLTETIATSKNENHPYGDKYSLNGIKWFSSATDSQVSVALARTGSLTAGSRGLSLFLIPLRLPLLPPPSAAPPSSISNGILVHRLKNKVGTHALPTAELSLRDTEGYLISPLNQGVKHITPVLNITRLWSSVTSVGHLRKALSIATAYAKVRAIHSGQTLLRDSPIHVAHLAEISTLYRALVHLVFGVVALMGKVECGVASESESRRLRMMTPVVKAFCAERGVGGVEEAMTALGGAGYMEENGLGRAVRDGLVEK
jgi:alkylation response protein AidB-like acyl-CoA dehydrogenase